LSQVNLEDTEIENEQLELNAGVIYFLGPNLTLRNCTLVLRVPARDLIIPQARFINCTIDVKKVLKNFRWEHAALKGCRFTGRLSGNDFGRWPTSVKAPGSIEDCDFSGARLNWTRFVGCDVRTLRFPSWPCFTIYDPVRRARELGALPWPGKRGRIIAEGFADDPPSTDAVTFEALELAKWCETTPEAIKAVLEKLDGVYF
jgi:hypothetical protein